MSDEEMFVDVNDEQDEYNISIKEELIALVKANPTLRKKLEGICWQKFFAKT